MTNDQLFILAITLAGCAFSIIINIVLVGIVIKLYTEILKDKSMDKRKGEK